MSWWSPDRLAANVADPLPGSPSGAAALADLERLTFTEPQHRPVLKPVRVTRNARAGPDLLVFDGGGMTGADGGADDRGRYGGDLGRAFIVRVRRRRLARSVDTAASAASCWRSCSGRPRAGPRSVISPPPRRKAPVSSSTTNASCHRPPSPRCLPDQRCIVGIDVAPLSGGAIDADAQHKLCDRPIEAQQQPAISRGRVSEWSPRGPGWLRLGTDHRGGGDLAGAVHRVASEGARRERPGPHRSGRPPTSSSAARGTATSVPAGMVAPSVVSMMNRTSTRACSGAAGLTPTRSSSAR